MCFLDTTIPTSTFKVISTIPASANIIYEELVNGNEASRYNLMTKREPHVLQENSHSHLKFQKVYFELPETFPLRIIFNNRFCYTKEYHGVGEDGICYIISKKIRSSQDSYSNEIEMGSYEESFTIIPVSGAESKIIFISKFDYGGDLFGIVKHKIAVERLNHLKCIKSYFQKKNQEKIYETFRTGTQIVEELQRASLQEINNIKIETEEIGENKDEEMKYLEEEIEEERIPDEDSLEMAAEIDEASEIQSINDNFLDLTSTFMKSNPFIHEKIQRNTLNVRPSYLKKDLTDKKISAMNIRENEVEVIYEEVDDDF